MSSDYAIAKLVKLLSSKDERVVLAAARDLADRANLSGTQNVEVTVEKGRSFEDFVGDALVDVAEDDNYRRGRAAQAEDIVNAEVVEEPPLMNRHDRKAFAEVDRQRALQERLAPSPSGERGPTGDPALTSYGRSRSMDGILAAQQREQDAILHRVQAQERQERLKRRSR
jgi:hypothetical protein